MNDNLQTNYHQEKAQILKELNFLFNSPSLSPEQRKKVNETLRSITEELKTAVLQKG